MVVDTAALKDAQLRPQELKSHLGHKHRRLPHWLHQPGNHVPAVVNISGLTGQ